MSILHEINLLVYGILERLDAIMKESNFSQAWILNGVQKCGGEMHPCNRHLIFDCRIIGKGILGI